MNFQDILNNTKLSNREKCDQLFGLKLLAMKRKQDYTAIDNALSVCEKAAKKEIASVDDDDDTENDD